MRNASKFERIIDGLIPLAILLIIIVTVADIFFSKKLQYYYVVIDLIDLFIVFIFSMDLIFKLEHAKSVPSFLRKYWFYIVAIFPFFLVFRIFQRFYNFSAVSSGSTIILFRYLGGLLSESRIAKLAEITRFFGIPARLLEATYFFENPKIRHKINVKRLLKLRKKRKRR